MPQPGLLLLARIVAAVDVGRVRVDQVVERVHQVDAVRGECVRPDARRRGIKPVDLPAVGK